jgi:hypothetical protein
MQQRQREEQQNKIKKLKENEKTNHTQDEKTKM